jgi:hypothetical protein
VIVYWPGARPEIVYVEFGLGSSPSSSSASSSPVVAALSNQKSYPAPAVRVIRTLVGEPPRSRSESGPSEGSHWFHVPGWAAAAPKPALGIAFWVPRSMLKLCARARLVRTRHAATARRLERVMWPRERLAQRTSGGLAWAPGALDAR